MVFMHRVKYMFLSSNLNRPQQMESCSFCSLKQSLKRHLWGVIFLCLSIQKSARKEMFQINHVISCTLKRRKKKSGTCPVLCLCVQGSWLNYTLCSQYGTSHWKPSQHCWIPCVSVISTYFHTTQFSSCHSYSLVLSFTSYHQYNLHGVAQLCFQDAYRNPWGCW